MYGNQGLNSLTNQMFPKERIMQAMAQGRPGPGMLPPPGFMNNLANTDGGGRPLPPWLRQAAGAVAGAPGDALGGGGLDGGIQQPVPTSGAGVWGGGMQRPATPTNGAGFGSPNIPAIPQNGAGFGAPSTVAPPMTPHAGPSGGGQGSPFPYSRRIL